MAIATAGSGYLVYKAMNNNFALDFRLIWVAGKVWLSGATPYGPRYLPIYDTYFSGRPNSHFWVYPPYWMPIAAIMSTIPFTVAAKVWSLIQVACVAAGSYFFAAANAGRAEARTLIPLVFGAAALSHSTVATLSLGQTSLLVFLGVSLYYLHFARGDRWALITALVLLLLKPNIGVMFTIFAVVRGRYVETASAALIVALLQFPSLYLQGAGEILGFLHALGQYNRADLAANLPPDMTGLANLMSLATHNIGAKTVLVLTAAMAIFATVLAMPGRGYDERRRVSGLIILTYFLVPLHDYDITTLIMPALCLCIADRRFIIPVAVCLTLLVRPDRLAALTGLAHPRAIVFPATLIVSVVIVALSILWLLAIRLARPSAMTPSLSKSSTTTS